TKFNQESDFQFQPSFFNELFRKNADADIVDKTIADPHIPLHRWGFFGTHRYRTETDWLTYSDLGANSDPLFTRELVTRFDLPTTTEQTIRQSRFGRSQFGVFRNWGGTPISTGPGGSTKISFSPPRQRYKGHRRSPFGAAASLADFHWSFAGERKA